MGDWSASSVHWQRVDGHTRNLAESTLQSEGEVWMSYTDWLRTFTHIEVIHLDADTARDEPSLIGKTPWMLRLYHGRWQKGVTAGGCRNNIGKVDHAPLACSAFNKNCSIQTFLVLQKPFI